MTQHIFFLCFFVSSLTAIIASEDEHQKNPLKILDENVISIVYCSDIPTLYSLRCTCKYFNETLKSPIILQNMVDSADFDWCSKKLDYFSEHNQIDLFNVFFRNNEEQRKRQIIQFFNSKKPKPDWFGEDMYVQRSVEEIYKNVIIHFDWEDLLSNLFIIKTIAFSKNPNIQDQRGRTLLTWSCGHDYRNVFKKIGNEYKTVLLSDEIGLNLMHILLQNKATNFDEKERNLNFTEKKYSGFTGFIMACWMGKIEIIKLLLNQKDLIINLNETNNNGDTIFTLICCGFITSHTREVMKLLLQEERIEKNYELLCKQKDKVALLLSLMQEELGEKNFNYILLRDLFKHIMEREEYWQRRDALLLQQKNSEQEKYKIEKEAFKEKHKQKVTKLKQYATELRDIITRKAEEYSKGYVQQQEEYKRVVTEKNKLLAEKLNYLKMQEKIDELERKICDMKDQHKDDFRGYQNKIDEAKLEFERQKTARTYKYILGFGLFNVFLMYLLYSYDIIIIPGIGVHV